MYIRLEAVCKPQGHKSAALHQNFTCDEFEAIKEYEPFEHLEAQITRYFTERGVSLEGASWWREVLSFGGEVPHSAVPESPSL